MKLFLAGRTACSFYLSVFCFIVWVLPANARQSLDVDNHFSKYPLGKHISIFEDKNNRCVISEIVSADTDGQFIPSTRSIPSYGFSQSTFWVRFDATNITEETLPLIIESHWPHHDLMEFYLFSNGSLIKKEIQGDHLPFNSRVQKYINPIFPFQMAARTSYTAYLKIKSKASMILDFVLWEPEVFSIHAIHTHSLFGLYYGAVLIMILYNLFIFFGIQEKIYYLYYVLFISSLLLIQMSLDGFAYAYLWPSHPTWASQCVNIFVFSGVFWGTLFCQKFLNTRANAPRHNLLLNILAVISFTGIWALFFTDILIAGMLASFTGIVFAVLSFLAGLTCLVKGVREARYFFSASVFLLTGMILVALGYAGFIEKNFLSTFAMHIGTTIQALLLSFGLVDRINKLKREHSRIQEANLTMQKEFSRDLQREIELKTLDLNRQKVQLEQANAELQKINTLKSNFFANLSHELRTPLTLIRGWTDYIISGELGQIPDRLKETIRKIDTQNLALTEKINHMLKLSKFDAGMSKIVLHHIDMETTVAGIVANFQDLATHKNIALNFSSRSAIGSVLMDREKLTDILNNLIRNAYKFTENGKIDVILSSDGNKMAIEVRDTGIGMNEETLQKIFQRFQQGDNAPAQLFEGTGLGLAIVKESVDLLHGTVTVTSAERQGTAFTVQIPLDLGELEPDAIMERRRQDRRSSGQDNGPEDRRRNLRREDDIAKISGDNIIQILAADVKTGNTDKVTVVETENARGKLVIAEDNLAVQALLQAILKEYTLYLAPNGQLAWETIQKEQPDLILSDIMMPLMDGYSLVENIKSDKNTKNIPIILITASANKTDRIKGLQLGADDFLTKPFHHLELKARVNNVISLRKLYREKLRSEQLEIFLMVLASAIESKDKYTGGHVERVANYARDLAQKMRLPEDKINEIYLGTIVHDIGKIGIRDDVLNKAGRLTEDELRHIQEHPVIGKELLSKLELLPAAVNIAFGHQEKWDGTGYPRKLKGRDIPIEARISTVADFWDAITSDRPYRRAIPVGEAAEIMRQERGRTFDPELLDAFMDNNEKLYLKYLATGQMQSV
ncbi:MAG: 7TM diverse intracellular signaling domain-containing protein [Thermodesulfobacteriota bacterium]